MTGNAEKYFSEISGTQIISETEGLGVGFVSEIIIDPLNGAIAGISLDRKFSQVIPAIDIRILGNPTIISTVDAVSEPEDIIKIRQILESNAKLLNNKVFTKSGLYLGKVYDFAVDVNVMALTKIAVSKNILGLIRFNEILLPHTEIVEITPEKIIIHGNAAVKSVVASERTGVRRKAKACAECD